MTVRKRCEDREIELAHSDRSKTPIEPYLADQWFVKMGDTDGKPGLAQPRMDAVTDGRVENHPRRATPRAISIGSAKNATGPSAGNFGGDTGFRSGQSNGRVDEQSHEARNLLAVVTN